MKFRIYKPEIFQGSLKLRNYFEGWYFKHVSHDLEHVWSFIPGVALTKNDPHAFIQVMNGIKGSTEYLRYSINEFSCDKDRLFLKVGSSLFTENEIDLKIENDKINVTGHLNYSNIIKYPKRLLSPGIMGWYSFVPFMECKHAIVSVNHDLSGTIKVNDSPVDFTGGNGYIEKDWGTSFPEAWIWIQANNFADRNSSFSFSVAKIPWLGKYFPGFIAFLYCKGRFNLFSTYNNSAITKIESTPGSIYIELKNKDSVLKVNVKKSTFGELRAPVSGDMSRRIKESIDSEVNLNLSDKNNNILYTDTSTRAGLEVIEKIFDYIKI